MKLGSILTLLITFFQLPLFSQSGAQTYTISGSIVDNQKVPIPFANAAVYDNADSTMVTGAASNETGVFSIPLRPGNYYMKITFLSYREELIPNVNIINRDVNLGTIVLEPDSRLLETVEIEGERS